MVAAEKLPKQSFLVENILCFFPRVEICKSMNEISNSKVDQEKVPVCNFGEGCSKKKGLESNFAVQFPLAANITTFRIRWHLIMLISVLRYSFPNKHRARFSY